MSWVVEVGVESRGGTRRTFLGMGVSGWRFLRGGRWIGGLLRGSIWTGRPSWAL